MIIEDSGIKGLTSDLAHLDQVMDKLGFVRWQWEYYRATYDLKLEDSDRSADYYLRINTRVTSGKLEAPDAELVIEEAYIGKTTFPHGLDYNAPIPDDVLKASKQKLSDLKTMLTA